MKRTWGEQFRLSSWNLSLHRNGYLPISLIICQSFIYLKHTCISYHICPYMHTYVLHMHIHLSCLLWFSIRLYLSEWLWPLDDSIIFVIKPGIPTFLQFIFGLLYHRNSLENSELYVLKLFKGQINKTE